MEEIRQPVVAGMFYPGTEQILKEELIKLFNESKPLKDYGKVHGIIAPHAGYTYSGKTAAAVYNTLSDSNYDTVVIISPSHREYFPGVCVYEGDAYSTPLGNINVNKEMREKLIDGSKLIFEGIQGHRQEHALEVQLPFLQIVLKDFKILPIVMGDQGKLYVDELAEKLAKITDENTLIVASSDLSHFYTKDQASKLDAVIEQRINEFKFEELQKDIEAGLCEACGGGPIVAMMKAADMKHYRHAEVVSRSDSGDVTGDKSEVVGYLSAVVY